MKISEVDKNFALKSELSRKDVIAYDVCSEPFRIYGVIPPKDDNDVFRRMPEDVAKSVSDGVYFLHSNTAGGRIRFKTDADYIAIHAEMPVDKVGKMSHFPFSGSAGFDLYTEICGKQYYVDTYIPSTDIVDGFDSEVTRIPNPSMREYTINMPLYSDVSKLYVILNEGASVLPCRDYKIETPVVYYGSSITQGGCASRPGNAYQAMITRLLDCDHINLGFSGNAKGEDEIADYIAGLDMSVFVYDYDHNAPDEAHLEATHKKMFDRIRRVHPELPIICVSRPVSVWCDEILYAAGRRAIVKKTVDEALKSGDRNVYFVDGADFASKAYLADSISVDGCHPNDLGFSCMAEVIGEKVKMALGL